MNNNFKNELLTEAIRIGDDLLHRVEKDANGFSWQTMGMGEKQAVVWNKSEGLYSGVAGIVLFFIELYKQTKNQKYLEAVKEGSRWVAYYCENNPTAYYAFFTGRMGAAYMMLQVGELLKDESYHKKALDIAAGCEQYLAQPNGIDDLINGSSGTLLGLIHLHAHTKEESLMTSIKKITDHLIKAAHIGHKGLYWDRSSKSIRGLCGFSHGASGIGYVFLELGRYFNDKTFYWIAEQAFMYENQFYDNKTGNWPDFRKGYFDDETFEEHKAEYLNGNKPFFTTPGSMSAWCHGAPGIGLSRLRAHELLNNPQYLTDINKAVIQTHKATIESENTNASYTVCHGAGGNAMLFLDAYRTSKENKYLDYAEKVGENGLKFIQENRKYISGYSTASVEDYSLFMGNAGVGYYYLQLCEPLTTPSIVKPDVKTNAAIASFSIGINAVKTKIASRYFSKTTSLCAAIEFKEKESIVHGVRKGVEIKNDERLTSIFNYEMEKFKLQNSIESDSYVEISSIIEAERNQNFINKSQNGSILSASFKINSNTKLLNTDWDCVDVNNKEKGAYYSLVEVTSNAFKEHQLPQFSYLVLNLFEKEIKASTALHEISNMYDANTEDEKKMIENSFIDQVKEALSTGILVQVVS